VASNSRGRGAKGFQHVEVSASYGCATGTITLQTGHLKSQSSLRSAVGGGGAMMTNIWPPQVGQAGRGTSNSWEGADMVALRLCEAGGSATELSATDACGQSRGR
jgi:hypothetical protein